MKSGEASGITKTSTNFGPRIDHATHLSLPLEILALSSGLLISIIYHPDLFHKIRRLSLYLQWTHCIYLLWWLGASKEGGKGCGPSLFESHSCSWENVTRTRGTSFWSGGKRIFCVAL